MTSTELITVAGIAFANIATVIGMFMWATARADLATQNHRIESQNMTKETQAILKGISDEMKDFHGRLCAIEERNRK